ncbi:MAG: cell surface protein, partial [Pauljensenia sp.]
MGNRPIIAALGAPGLAATMLGLAPTAAVAAPETPYHPTVLWATSEEKVGEGAPNGTIAALTDDDSARTDATKTFWTTKWKGGMDTYPHALAVQNPTPGTQVCGLGLTPRPTYDSTLGNDQFPGEYRVFAFDEDPGNPASGASFADWKTSVAKGTWEGGTEVTHGTNLTFGNKEQYVTFKATTKRVIALAGLRSLAPGKSDMALSDIK